MKTVTKTIFSKLLKAGESEPFSYRPEPDEAKAVGLLLGKNVEGLSLAFDNGTELLFNQLAPSGFPDFPPDSRIIQLDHVLNGKLIKGMVKADTSYFDVKVAEVKEEVLLEDTAKSLISVYLIIEKKEL